MTPILRGDCVTESLILPMENAGLLLVVESNPLETTRKPLLGVGCTDRRTAAEAADRSANEIGLLIARVHCAGET